MAIEKIGSDDAVAKVRAAQEIQQSQKAAQQTQQVQAPVVEKPKETKPEPKNDKESFDAKKIGVLAEAEQKLDSAKGLLNITALQGLTNRTEADQISGAAQEKSNDLAQAAKGEKSNEVAAASQEKDLAAALAGTKQEPVAQEAGGAQQAQDEIRALLEQGNALRDKLNAAKSANDQALAAASASSDAKNK